ncbi:MAG TPA: DUF2993 domain-containing protein, partial [Mycobacteriales bacterium]|nr:DUF2993 domain-containing protein [Mycobacteriales bacterium]
DRVGAIVGAHVLAGKVQTDEGLANRPSASIGGFPFLTQAISGNYKDVTITANNVAVGDVIVSTLTAHLHGMHLSLHSVLHGSVSHVPVDRVNAIVVVTYAEVNQYLRSQHVAIQVAPGTGNQVHLVERVSRHHKHLSLSGDGTVSVTDNVFDVNVTKVAGVSALATRLLHISVPLRGIPFRVDVQSVTSSSTGLTGTGGATNIVLGSH